MNKFSENNSESDFSLIKKTAKFLLSNMIETFQNAKIKNEQVGIEYRDEDGNLSVVTHYSIIDKNCTKMSGVNVVAANCEVKNDIHLTGPTAILLCDTACLTVFGSIYLHSHSLSIYCGKNGTGKMQVFGAKASENSEAKSAVYIDDKCVPSCILDNLKLPMIYIYGGNIEFTGGFGAESVAKNSCLNDGAVAIKCYDECCLGLDIYGGKVAINGGDSAFGKSGEAIVGSVSVANDAFLRAQSGVGNFASSAIRGSMLLDGGTANILSCKAKKGDGQSALDSTKSKIIKEDKCLEFRKGKLFAQGSRGENGKEAPALKIDTIKLIDDAKIKIKLADKGIVYDYNEKAKNSRIVEIESL